MEKTISLTTNYTITKASPSVLMMILVEVYGGLMSDYLEIDKFSDKIAKALRNYDGIFKNAVKRRTGHNIVPLVLRATLAEMIVGNVVTPTMEANYIALGDGTTTPSNTDTTLDNETLRSLFTDREAIDNVAYLDKYFSSGDVGGNTYLEAGVFVDGTGSADTGYLLSRILINEIMGVSETLTVNCSFTIT